MVQFTRLRLQGFKSFTDKTELEITEGLNGVIGPNGCGKSNLVEALRWVMGESSAKRMRGDGMDDVIFNGTKSRPQKNIAEVSLLLNNSERKAPAAYNGSDDIEITRKIERDKGSSYRINGKIVRARDVQMFFADSVSGANSPALVSQGRVTEIIKAKPMERRLILEDSAGISGLFVRRHEARLKLKAASNNLQRIDDVFQSMTDRLKDLEKQVEQADKYKALSAKIRELDLQIAYLEHHQAQENLIKNKALFSAAEGDVAKNLLTVTQLNKALNIQSENLPSLRKEEAKAAATLQNYRITLQRIEDEHNHNIEMSNNILDQLERINKDITHEQGNLSETDNLLNQLESEKESLLTQIQACKTSLTESESNASAAQESLTLAQADYNTAAKAEAEAKARETSLLNQISHNQKRLETITERHDITQEKLNNLIKDYSQNTVQQQSEDDYAAAEKSLADLQDKIEQASATVKALTEQYNTAKDTQKNIQNNIAACSSEIAILSNVVNNNNEHLYAPILDQVKAKPGFEKAFSRAMGDTLMASLDSKAPSYWSLTQNASALPALPDNCKPLSYVVEDAPAEITAALTQIGYVDNNDHAATLVPQLQCGQSLVSLDGMYWRWDGLVVKPEATDQNAINLEYKNKISLLEGQLQTLKQSQETADKAAQSAQDELQSQTDKLAAQQDAAKIASENLSALRKNLAEIREKNARRDAQKEHLESSLRLAKDDIETVKDILKWDEKRLSDLQKKHESEPDQETDTLKQRLDNLNQDHHDAITTLARIKQQNITLSARLQALGDERINANNRSIRSRERIKELEKTQLSLQKKQDEFKKQPKLDDKKKNDLLTKISAAEKQRTSAADALINGERAANEAQHNLKNAENALSLAREKRALAQATYSNDQENIVRLSNDIQERFGEKIETLAKQHAIQTKNTTVRSAKNERDTCIQKRNAMGPVNLRANDEYNTLNNDVSVMITEREDLLSAIEELQTGIKTINKEARERLTKAFDKVNAHFQTLFQELFVGGKAYLELVGSTDPLEAGLEIFAQPPGKSLQSLSLLSGGEQTMASIALIFGMFLTNPSPICVLDEIDAPLDDANVDRVCNLLEKISQRGETRFIVITHHRLTMARMNRLYGLTMQERGISELLSIDLQRNFDFIKAA